MLFALIRQEGSGWDRSRALREQDNWAEHAAYVDVLAEEGFVRLAGPIGTGSQLFRVLLIVEADNDATVHARIDEDPWTPICILETASLEPWHLLVGDVPAHPISG